MSYYRPSFKQTAAMSRGGRGYSSRGSSYRGNRGSSWDRGGRGSFSSSRGGRFSSSWNTGHSNSFESRPRYSSSSGERYSASHGRNEESSYRRSSYRSEGPNNSYSSRDTSTRSPERKRIRPEAPSSRRSHEGGYSGGDGGYGGGSGSRYESTQGYGERRSFEDRRPSFRTPREEFRKPGPPVSSRSPRGGYRGRISTRGTRGSRISLVRRRVLDTRSYVRRRGAPLRSTADYLRAMRMSKLRSGAVIRRIIKRTKDAEKDDSDKEEENWDDEGNEKEKKKDSVSEKGEEDETEETDEKKSPVKKSPKKEIEAKEKDSSSDKEVKKEESSDEDDRPRSKYTGRPFIRLTCTHCKMKCVTFKEYSIHLYSGIHISAMRKIALRQKAVLGRMRASQRLHQRELEKNEENLGTRTIFCPLCKLNYRQKKEVHQMSDAHKSMKKFLMPYCRTCYITFKSPMLYENHICSLDHIRRKASNEAVNGEKHASDKEADSPAEEDLENFMTLDSVGDVDEEDEDGNKIPKAPATDGEPAKPKESINVGVEHCKKVEVYYCDLCRVYLNRNTEEEQILNSHCGGRMHLQRYVRYKKDKELLRQAEKIHRKSQEAKEAKQKEIKTEDKVKTDKNAADGEKVLEEDKIKQEQTEEEAGDDKMWEDVDKDLGEILAEVNTEAGNKSSDEDEDSRPNGERYDRFKLHKGIDEKGDSKTKKTNAEDKGNEDKAPVEEEEEKMEEDAEQGDDK